MLRPAFLCVLVPVLALTSCGGSETTGDGSSVAPSSSTSITPADIEVPSDPQEAVNTWWNAIKEGNLGVAQALMSEDLRAKYYSDDRLKAMSASMAAREECAIRTEDARSVEGGYLISTDLSGCEFNELKKWTWRVDKESGLIIGGDSTKRDTEKQ